MAVIDPNVSLYGTLVDVISPNLEPNLAPSASIQIALCGYGSQIPRISGEAMFANATSFLVSMEGGNPPGAFRVNLYSNDLIEPDGTYYTATVFDANGDVLQVNAYRFTANQNLDISTLVPYDPNQLPPPLPPLITNQLLIVPWSATMEFPGDIYTSFRTTLAGDVTSSTAPDTMQGNLYTFIIQQDAAGGHIFTWPTDSLNASPINPNPSGLTTQTFVRDIANLIAISAATWWD